MIGIEEAIDENYAQTHPRQSHSWKMIAFKRWPMQAEAAF